MSDRNGKRWIGTVTLENGTNRIRLIKRTRKIQGANSAMNFLMEAYPDWREILVTPY